jgi:signal transduction histidine kinase
MHQDAPDRRFSGAAELPLDSAMGAALIQALLSSAAERSALLQGLMESNPVFTAWCRSTAAASGDIPSDNLSGWVSDRLPQLLTSLVRPLEQRIESPDWQSLLRIVIEHARRSEILEANFDNAVQRAKLDALKELAYGASHEINNPLANISLRAQSLLTDETDPDRRRKLAQIHVQALRAHEMIADLMLFARPPQLKRERVDICSIVKNQVDSLQERAADQGTRLETQTAEQPYVATVDALQLAVAIRALILNALEALGSGGTIQLQVAQSTGTMSDSEESETVTITVADNGPGILESAKPHLFDPFFSGREAGRGLGFGLTKAWRIVTDHGGDITQHPTPGGGATFVVTLPANA